MSNKNLLALLVFAGVAAIGTFASAAVVPFGSVTASGSQGTGDNPALSTNGIKTSGDGNNDWNTQAVRDNDGTVILTFDLGASYSLNQIDVSLATNVPAGVSRPVSVNLWFSATPTFAVAADQNFDSTGWTQSNSGWGTQIDQAIPVSATAQYVKLRFNAPGGGQPWVGVTEVQFDTAAVPEPASLGLLSLGGLTMLRRRRA